MKNNYGPEGEVIQLRWDRGRYVLVGAPGSFERAAFDAKIDVTFMDLLRKTQDQNRNVSPNPGRTYAPAIFADIEGSHGFKSKQFTQAMNRLLEANKIKIETYGKRSEPRQRLIIT